MKWGAPGSAAGPAAAPWPPLSPLPLSGDEPAAELIVPAQRASGPGRVGAGVYVRGGSGQGWPSRDQRAGRQRPEGAQVRRCKPGSTHELESSQLAFERQDSKLKRTVSGCRERSSQNGTFLFNF